MPNSSSKEFTFVPFLSSPPSVPNTNTEPLEWRNFRNADNWWIEWEMLYVMYRQIREMALSDLFVCEFCLWTWQHKNAAFFQHNIAQLVVSMSANKQTEGKYSSQLQMFCSPSLPSHISTCQVLRMCLWRWRKPVSSENGSSLVWLKTIKFVEEEEDDIQWDSIWWQK